MHQLRGELSPGGAEGVPQRDGAAVHVDDARVHAKFLDHGQGLRREGLVELDEFEIRECEPPAREGLGDGLDGADAHDVGIDAGHRKAHEARQRRETERFRFGRAHEQHGGRAVGVRTGIAGRDRTHG